MKAEKFVSITVSIPKESLPKIKKKLVEYGMKTRSEYVRKVIKENLDGGDENEYFWNSF